MDSGPTFVFAGGGSGGHLFPGIAVAEELRRRDPSARIVFVGSSRTIESTIVARYGLEHRTLPVEPLPMLKRNPLRFIWQNWQALKDAKNLVRELRPMVVVGLGGFASAPLVLAASRQRIRVILLEQNVIPGRTTRWLGRVAEQICVSFEETRSHFTGARGLMVTGNAVRSEIAALHPRDKSSALKPNLLILGGSQGADSLNEAVLAAIRDTRDALVDWTITHQTGPRQVDQVRQAYDALGLTAVVEPFFDDMPRRYSEASLVVSRAGATTLAELACAGVAMILLPFAHAADDHQTANARVFVDRHSALLVPHEPTNEATAKELVVAMRKLLINSAERGQMGQAAKQFAHPEAAEKIAQIIVDHKR